MLIDRYEHTDRMREALERIEAARVALEAHLDQPEDWHGVIRRQVLAAVIHYSTAIEGNVLTRDQVESIIAGEAIEAPEKDRIEALNYYRAMRWAQARAQDAEWRLTHETVLTLHFLVGTELGAGYEPLGQYRRAQNTVQDRQTEEVIYWPPRAEDVRPLMDELVEWCRRRSDAHTNQYIVNALTHLNFVAIHPFSDGNGRVARLLCSLLMMRQGYKAQAFWSLEEYFGEHAQDYGSVIAQTLGPRYRADFVVATPWIEWYLNAVAKQVSEAEQHLGRSVAEFSAVVVALARDGLLPAERAVGRVVIPIWLALTGGTVTRRQLARYIDLAEDTISRDLGRLAKLGYLERVGRGRGAHYVAGPRVQAWGDFSALAAAAQQGGVTAVEKLLADHEEARKPTLFDDT